MNKISLIYDGKEIILNTKSKVEDVVSFFNMNSDEQFVSLESIEGNIGLNPRLVTLIKDITKNVEFNPCKDLKCKVNIDVENLASNIRDILEKEFYYSKVLGN